MSALLAHLGPRGYRRRSPEAEPLYRVLAGNLETFIERTRSAERQHPRYVERELRAYLECADSAESAGFSPVVFYAHVARILGRAGLLPSHARNGDFVRVAQDGGWPIQPHG